MRTRAHPFVDGRRRGEDTPRINNGRSDDWQRMLRWLGSPSLADFDVLGQKPQEDADPDWQKPALPKIDSMQFVDVAGIELLKQADWRRYHL
jgi:hypothetical protein